MTIASFIPSVTGLNAMSHSLNTVSDNIVNMNTTGYKQHETLFNTMLGGSGFNYGAQSGLHSSRAAITGVNYWDRNNILQEGLVSSTGNTFDVAISGNKNAFFTVEDEFGNIFYTRAGDFSKITQGDTTYLITTGGMNVQGFKSVDGGDEFANTYSDIILDAPQRIPQRETTEAKIIANVPASDVDSSIYTIRIYSDNYDGADLNMIFKQNPEKENAWLLSFQLQDGSASSDAAEVIFNTDGSIRSPENVTASINWDDGSRSSVKIDLSELTQYASSSQVTKIEQNGSPSANLIGLAFDVDGVLQAKYDNASPYNIAKLAITGFTAPENLNAYNTTLFTANGEVGNSFFVDTQGLIVPSSIERSTVDLAEEFSKMIVTQRTYSLNAQSFTVNDEMLSLLIDLKS
ncbi:MAG: flagellar hook-basal body complex protein [Alphaproteobacteria bacterium]|nr:flagellar hook-basal body complex protein [Alphaproteobacteria bacterium]MBQ9234913.1 flagellar hook-basal body complex protein [Alphaproteobacteria bacterium]